MFMLALAGCLSTGGSDDPDKATVPEAPVAEAPVPEAPVPEAPVPEAPEADAQAPDVKPAGDFAKQVQMCIHWAGEEPYDEERGRQIAKGVAESCTPAVARVKSDAAGLIAVPVSAAALVDLMSLEGDMGADRAAACKNALTHYRAQKEQGTLDLSMSAFEAECPDQAKSL